MLGWLIGKTIGANRAPVFLYNTLGNKREEFHPLGRTVRMYNCGPTVYDYQHIGNLSAAVFADTLRRMLEYNNYPVKQVINITDFGHLTSDADEGEDKMTRGLKREGMEASMENMKKMADRYTEAYMHDIGELGVEIAKIQFPRASEYIPAQIALIKTLDEKGYAYKTKDGLYFDTVLFRLYGALGGIDQEHMKEGARVGANPEKHRPADFVLWKRDDSFGWESPWGKGFPGWHIECSAMVRALLGEQIDIHTGGVEHIPIHHNNEIAQSEAATGRHPFARFWLHRAHIQIDGKKIAKSDGNTVYLKDVIERGIHPLALRYWFLTAHYRTPANFTWGALSSSYVAFLKLHRAVREGSADGRIPTGWQKRFQERINDDLDTPGAIAVMWELVKSGKHTSAEIRAALLDFDRVLRLGFNAPDAHMAHTLSGGDSIPTESLPKNVQELIAQRKAARDAKDWNLSDELRAKIRELGFTVRDKNDAQEIIKKEQAVE